MFHRVVKRVIPQHVRCYSSSTANNNKWKFSSWRTGGLLLSIPAVALGYILSTHNDQQPTQQQLLLQQQQSEVYNQALCLTPDVEGDSISLKNRVLDTGANLLQRKKPTDSIGLHLCALHFYSGDLKRQVVAHHYCTHLTEDVHQCVIYDTDKPNARLIGVEYIISEKLYKTLDEGEKMLWHSHAFEIKSGQLTMPGLPPVAEHAAMKEIVNTYGKTWHFWQVDRGDKLPLGIPSLMMALTADGQITPEMEESLNNQTWFTTIDERKQHRLDIEPHPVDSNANSWEKGETFKLELKNI